MSCKYRFNNKWFTEDELREYLEKSSTVSDVNNVVSVNTVFGETSALYDKVSKLPFVEKNSVLELFKTAFSDSLLRKIGNWQINPFIYTSYKNRLFTEGSYNNLDYSKSKGFELTKSKTDTSTTTTFANIGKILTNTTLNRLTLSDISDLDLSSDQIDSILGAKYLIEVKNIFDSELYPNSKEAGKVFKQISGYNSIKTDSGFILFDEKDLSYNNKLLHTTGEPKGVFLSNKNNVFDSYGDALRDSNGGFVQFGFVTSSDINRVYSYNDYLSSNSSVTVFDSMTRILDDSDFHPIMQFSTNMNDNVVEGMINNLVKSSLLSGDKVFRGDKIFYVGEGSLESNQILNANIAFTTVLEKLGRQSAELSKDNLLSISGQPSTPSTLVNEDGSLEGDINQIGEKLQKPGGFDKLSEKYGIESTIKSAYTHYKLNLQDSLISFKADEISKNNKSLEEELTNNFSKINLSTSGVDNYKKNYQIRTGSKASINTLSDITEDLINISNDRANAYPEETSSFILETYPNQSQVESSLSEIEDTPEYIESYNNYMSLFNDENLSRRAVLSDIVANRFLSEGDLSEDFVNSHPQITQLATDMINSVASNLSTSVENELNKTLSKVDSLEVREIIEDTHQPEQAFMMFHASKGIKDSIITVRKVLNALDQKLEMLQSSNDPTASSFRSKLQEINRLVEEGTKLEEEHAVKMIVAEADAMLNYLQKVFNEIDNNRTKNKSLNPGEQKLNESFNERQHYMYKIFVDELIPGLEGMQNIISEMSMSSDKEKDLVLNQIDRVNKEAVAIRIKGAALVSKDDYSTLKEIMNKYYINEDYYDLIKTLLEQEHKDISGIFKLYGNLEHASNPLLNTLGKIIAVNKSKADVRYQSEMTPLITKLSKLNWGMKNNNSIIEKTQDGKNSKFTISPYKMDLFEKNKSNAYREAYNKAMGTDFTEQEYKQKYRKNKKGDIVAQVLPLYQMTDEQYSSFNKDVMAWRKENEELRYTQEFYDRQEELYNKANLSRTTKDFLTQQSGERQRILAPFRKSNGDIDFEALMRDVEAWDSFTALNSKRKQSKSFLDIVNNTRVGRIVYDKNGIDPLLTSDGLLQIIPSDGVEVTDDRFIIAKDLNNLDYLYQQRRNQEGGSRTIRSEFFDTLSKLDDGTKEGRRKAWKFFEANGGIVFNEEFFADLNSQKGGSNVIGKLSDYENHPIYGESAKNLIELLRRQNEALRQYQTINNPAEVNYDAMGNTVIDRIKQYAIEIEQGFKTLNALLESRDESPISEPISESTTNKAYDNFIKDQKVIPNSKQELDLITQHMTDEKRRRVMKFYDNLQGVVQGNSKVSADVRYFFKSLYGEDTVVDPNFILEVEATMGLEKAAISFGKTKVYPYFKRFAPKGYDSFLSELQNGEHSIIDFVTRMNDRNSGRVSTSNRVSDVEKYLNVSTHFNWVEEEGAKNYNNPKFDKSFKGGISQPRFDKYVNDEFFNRFGINKNDYLNAEDKDSILEAKSNKTDFDILKDFWKVSEKAYELYGEPSTRSIYRLPQFSQGTTEKIHNLSNSSGKTLKNIYNELSKVRQDTMEDGARIDGLNLKDLGDVRIMPKYGLNDMEDSDLSYDLVNTYTQLLASATEYKYKKESMVDVIRLEGLMQNQNFKNGVKSKESNSFKMFNEFVDAYFYGIQRNRVMKVNTIAGEVDISKLISSFDKFVRYTNLAFNPAIAFTGITSASTFSAIERAVGQHVSTRSYSWADKEWFNLIAEHSANVGKLNRTDKMYKLGQFLGIYSTKDMVKAGSFSRIERATKDIGFLLTKVVNAPVAQKVMLAILDDTRLIDGRWYSYNDFKLKSLKDNLTDSQISSKWNSYKSQTLYNLMEPQPNSVEYKLKQSAIDEITNATQESVRKNNPTLTEDEVNKLIDSKIKSNLDYPMMSARGRIRSLASFLEGQMAHEDRPSATRDFLANFTMAHRGWFVSALLRRFKGEQVNYITGQYEIGSYQTAYKYIGALPKIFKGLDAFKNALKDVHHAYDGEDGDPRIAMVHKQNLRRVTYDVALSVILGAIGYLVAGIVDDPDNEDIFLLQYAGYIYFRTINEFNSSQLPFGLYGALDIFNTPFVAMNSIRQIMDIGSWFNFDEVQSGTYKGHSKFYKMVAKQTPIRHIYDLMDVKPKSDYFRFLNKETIWGLSKQKKEDAQRNLQEGTFDSSTRDSFLEPVGDGEVDE